MSDWSADLSRECPGHEVVDDKCPCCAALERIRALEGALADVFALIDEGFLVRDISKDADPLWVLNSLRFVTRLKVAHAVLSPPVGDPEKCASCRRGAPLNVDGNHFDHRAAWACDALDAKRGTR